MEVNSTIKDRWKFFTIAGLLGCLMLLVFYNENRQNASLPSSSVTLLVPKPTFQATASSMVVVPPEPSTPPPPTSTIFSEPSEIGSHHNNAKAIAPEAGSHNNTKALAPGTGSHNNNTKALAPGTGSHNNNTEDLAPGTASHSNNTKALAPETGADMELSNEAYRKASVVNSNTSLEKERTKKEEKECNMYDGRWVYKADAKPSYCTLKCPFLEAKMNCQKNGRPDFEYEKWVWEANDCDIPLLNGTDMVERFRNKRVIFVGDSLNRNMWESLACLLYSSIPTPSSKAKVINEDLHIKTFLEAREDYNFTVEFYWSPLLVDVDRNHSSGKKVMILDKLSPNSKVWSGADIMIFNSAHHWTQVGKKRKWDLYENKGKLINDMPLHQAYARAMKTWANWVERNVDPKKTTVFFRSISAEHTSSFYNQWCYDRTQPMLNESYKPPYPTILMRVIERVIKGMKKIKVKYMNVTKMSEDRIDAHPSIYRVQDWKLHSEINKHNLYNWADCGHWCLPGVPDTWNRLFYASLLLDNSRNNSSL